MTSDPEAIVLSDADVVALRSALLTDDGFENFSVLFCGSAHVERGIRLLVREVMAAPPDAYRQRLEHHLEISPSFLNHIIERSLRSSLSPVIAHSHPFAAAAHYSPSDDFGEERLMPVIRQLLPKFHPASLLMTPTAFAARSLEDGRFLPIQVHVAGRCSRQFANSRNAPVRNADSVDRQIRAIGIHGQQIISALRVAVIGVGGTGSAVAEELARLGLAGIIIVDEDEFEPSNLSRLWGSVDKDAHARTPKVKIVARHLKQIRPELVLTTIQQSVVKQSVLERLTDCDIVFCCTDNHLSRAVLNRFAYQYLVPVVDMGIRVDARRGNVVSAAGRVTLVGSGLACLRCSRHIDAETIRSESLAKDERALLASEGYVQGDPGPTPAVISLNTTVASLAVTTALQMFVNLTGGDPVVDQIYDAKSATIFHVAPRHDDGCDVCSPEVGVKALGDRQIISAY